MTKNSGRLFIRITKTTNNVKKIKDIILGHPDDVDIKEKVTKGLINNGLESFIEAYLKADYSKHKWYKKKGK